MVNGQFGPRGQAEVLVELHGKGRERIIAADKPVQRTALVGKADDRAVQGRVGLRIVSAPQAGPLFPLNGGEKNGNGPTSGTCFPSFPAGWEASDLKGIGLRCVLLFPPQRPREKFTLLAQAA